MGTAYPKARINSDGIVTLSDSERKAHIEKLMGTLKKAVEDDAQEINIISGETIDFKSKGVLTKVYDLGHWNDDDFNYFLGTLTKNSLPKQGFLKANELDTHIFEKFMDYHNYSHDFSVSLLQKTLRIHAVSIYNPQNAARKEKYCFTIRVVPTEIPSWDSLHLPDVFKRFSILKGGLVLISGHTGSGKSTTVATLVNLINTNPSQKRTILTVEEPIEFVHKASNSTVMQRSIGFNVESYKQATLDALRENVDVIVIGELRESEEMDNAIRLAETGKLVIATVHSNGPADTIDRIVNSFSGDIQDNVRSRLVENVVGILHQNLEVLNHEQIPVASGFIIENSVNKSKLRKDFSRNGITKLITSESTSWCMTQTNSFEELVAKKVVDDTPENRALLIQVK